VHPYSNDVLYGPYAETMYVANEKLTKKKCVLTGFRNVSEGQND